MMLVRGSSRWPETWSQVEPYLRDALTKGGDKDWSLEQIRGNLDSGRWGLYGVVSEEEGLVGAGCTAVSSYGLRNVLEIILFAANINSGQWVETLAQLKQEAKLMGCTAIQGRGRPGWARYLKAEPVNLFEIEV